MFLEDSAFDMEENPYSSHSRPHTGSSGQTSLSNSQSLSRPSTGGLGNSSGTLDMSRGRHSLPPNQGRNLNEALRDSYGDDDDSYRRGGNYALNSAAIGNSSSSRAKMLAQQRDIQIKKRMSAVQTGGMIRNLENPLAIPAKTTGSRPSTGSLDSQSTPAVRQFSAPKSIEVNNASSSEFSSRRPSANSANSADNRTKRGPPTDKPRRSSYIDDDDDDDDTEYIPRGNRGNQPIRGGGRSPYSSEEEAVPKRPSQVVISSTGSAPRSGNKRDVDREVSDGRVSRHQDDNRRQYPTAFSDDEDDDSENGKNSYSRVAMQNRRSAESRGDRTDREGDREWDKERSAQTRTIRNITNASRDADGKSWNTGSVGHEEKLSPRPLGNISPVPNVDRPLLTVPVPLNLTNMKAFLTSPVPKSAGIVECYIRRFKSATSLYPTYNLYLKDGNRFLLTAKKRPNNKTSNYLISMEFNDLSRDSSNYLGKVRSNFVGTEFQIYDNGVNPDKSESKGSEVQLAQPRKDLGVVSYAMNILGVKGPRKMQVWLPAVDEGDRIMTVGGGSDEEDMMERIKQKNFRDLLHLINKPPRWNDQVQAFVLNFNGRVTMASVKNFQLVDPNDQNAIILQFGRVSKDEFSMDMQWPVSPLQAFAVTMSSFDSKIACD